MGDRALTDIDVLVYEPLATTTEEVGLIWAAYPLALLSVSGGFYLIDPFGVGSTDLNQEGLYNQPVYQVYDTKYGISFQDPIVGVFPMSKKHLNLLIPDTTMDLGGFIEATPAGDYRLERWCEFVREEKAGA